MVHSTVVVHFLVLLPAGSFTLPWDFRRQQQSGGSSSSSSSSESPPPDSTECLIKGNIASDGDKVRLLPLHLDLLSSLSA
jgi:hypothetical protein